jgi:hypothetical protein
LLSALSPCCHDERQRVGSMAWLLGMRVFVVGAIAGAAIAAPYNPPRYYYSAPVVAPPPVVVAPAPAPVVVTTPYPVCPAYGPMPYYCR